MIQTPIYKMPGNKMPRSTLLRNGSNPPGVGLEMSLLCVSSIFLLFLGAFVSSYSISNEEFTVTEKAYILDFLQNTDKKIAEKIKEKSLSLRETTQLKPLQVKCSGCGHDYEQMFTLNVSDFFV